MRWFVLVGALSLWMPSRAEALCVGSSEVYVAINAGAAVPANGGLVVQTLLDSTGKDPMLGPAKWKLVSDIGTSAPALDVLAPGLAVIRLPAKAKSAELREEETVLGVMTRAATAPRALAAPEVTSIVHASWPNRRGNSTLVSVIPTSVPDGALAMIIADAKTGKVHSFGKPEAGLKEIRVYYQGRCSALPNGTVETHIGDRVVVRWVDRFGRLSPPSKVTTVVERKPPAN